MLQGIWLSHYEYGRGPNDEPHTSEYLVQFTETKGKWIGTSLPKQDGSKVHLVLVQDGSELAGEWVVHTPPAGYYQGREFKGLVIFLFDATSMEYRGMWIGATSHARRVKTGAWTLKRKPEESHNS